jgi:hypothetical protein
MDGTLQHNITELIQKQNQLFIKIEYGKNFISDEIVKIFVIKEEK